jgi:hypothetical protein
MNTPDEQKFYFDDGILTIIADRKLQFVCNKTGNYFERKINSDYIKTINNGLLAATPNQFYKVIKYAPSKQFVNNDVYVVLYYDYIINNQKYILKVKLDKFCKPCDIEKISQKIYDIECKNRLLHIKVDELDEIIIKNNVIVIIFVILFIIFFGICFPEDHIVQNKINYIINNTNTIMTELQLVLFWFGCSIILGLASFFVIYFVIFICRKFNCNWKCSMNLDCGCLKLCDKKKDDYEKQNEESDEESEEESEEESDNEVQPEKVLEPVLQPENKLLHKELSEPINQPVKEEIKEQSIPNNVEQNNDDFVDEFTDDVEK